MSESSEKHFDPTPSRVAKAKREGNVARSAEFGANVAFMTAAVCVVAIGPSFSGTAREALILAARGAPASGDALALVSFAALVVAAAALGGAGASLVQTGGLVVVMPSPKFSRLSPVEGFKRILSRETATHAVRAILASLVAGSAIVASMRNMFASAATGGSSDGIAAAAWSGAQHAVFAGAAVGLVFSALEYGVARRTWLNRLKMSLHDLKREMKENDGDPFARQRRKAMHRSLIRGSLAKVRDASFVVVNPTHVAVALEYRPPSVPVPVVLVRASDEMALRVREAATAAGVPIVEDISLARALFAQTDVGDPIPAEQYVAVAEIVASLVRSGALQ